MQKTQDMQNDTEINISLSDKSAFPPRSNSELNKQVTRSNMTSNLDLKNGGAQKSEAVANSKDDQANRLLKVRYHICKLINRTIREIQTQQALDFGNNYGYLMARGQTLIQLGCRSIDLAYQINHNFEAVLQSKKYKFGRFVIEELLKRPVRASSYGQPWAPELYTENTYKVFRERRRFIRLRADLQELMNKQTGFEFIKTPQLKSIVEDLKDCVNRIIKLNTLQIHLFWEIYKSRKMLLGRLVFDWGLKCWALPFAKPWAPDNIKDIEIQLSKILDGFQTDCRQVSSTQLRPPIKPPLPTVVQFTPEKTNNPYYTMLTGPLKEQGLPFIYCNSREKLLQMVAEQPEQCWIVHFHQLEGYYHGADAVETSAKAADLLSFIKQLKQLGVKIIWTNHNPLPHDRKFAELDRSFTLELCKLLDHSVVLGNYAKKAFCHDFAEGITREKVTVIPHPNFRNYYGEPASREEARAKLNISKQALVFGMLGELKPYKGLENLIAAAKQIGTSTAERPVEFLIIGRCKDPAYLESLISSCPANVRIINSFVANPEIPSYLAAFDFSVFCFRDIWASSSVILSLSYNVPVIAPRMGCLPEYVSDTNNGFLYDQHDPSGLQNTLSLAASGYLSDHLAHMTKIFGRELQVEFMAEKMLETYRFTAQPDLATSVQAPA